MESIAKSGADFRFIFKEESGFNQQIIEIERIAFFKYLLVAFVDETASSIREGGKLPVSISQSFTACFIHLDWSDASNMLKLGCMPAFLANCRKILTQREWNVLI
jgi:hypothetical protein